MVYSLDYAVLFCIGNLNTPVSDEAIAVTSYLCVNTFKIVLSCVLSFIAAVAIAVCVRLAIEQKQSHKSKTAFAAVPLGIILLFTPFEAKPFALSESADDEADMEEQELFEEVDNPPSSYFLHGLIYTYLLTMAI